MCVVSMVGDHYGEKFKRAPWWDQIIPMVPTGIPTGATFTPLAVTREEFDDLKRDVQEMKELLKRAKEYDERNHEPDCEVDEKMDLLRRVAEAVGINLDDVIGSKS